MSKKISGGSPDGSHEPEKSYNQSDRNIPRKKAPNAALRNGNPVDKEAITKVYYQKKLKIYYVQIYVAVCKTAFQKLLQVLHENAFRSFAAEKM